MSLLVKAPVIELDTTKEEEQQQPLRVEVIANVTEAYLQVWVMFDAKITGGTPPYSLPILNRDNHFQGAGFAQSYFAEIVLVLVHIYTVFVTIEDNTGKRAYNDIQLTVNERPPEGGGGGESPPDGEKSITPPDGG
jgi:hypothetical protein